MSISQEYIHKELCQCILDEIKLSDVPKNLLENIDFNEDIYVFRSDKQLIHVAAKLNLEYFIYFLENHPDCINKITKTNWETPLMVFLAKPKLLTHKSQTPFIEKFNKLIKTLPINFSLESLSGMNIFKYILRHENLEFWNDLYMRWNKERFPLNQDKENLLQYALIYILPENFRNEFFAKKNKTSLKVLGDIMEKQPNLLFSPVPQDVKIISKKSYRNCFHYIEEKFSTFPELHSRIQKIKFLQKLNP